MELSYIDIAIKLAIGLMTLVGVINISGKGNLAPNSATDQVQNYILGGIIGGVIYNPSISILQYCIILLIWTILVFTLKWLKTNNRWVKRTMDGVPTFLIKNGQVDVEACRSLGLTAQDLTFKLRAQGIYSVKLVKRAVMEQNGQLTIVQSGEENPKYPLITDGVVDADVLEMIGLTEDWLIEELERQGYAETSRIFIAEYSSGKISVIPYGE